MTDWTAPDAVDRLLFDGESVVLNLPVGAGTDNEGASENARVVVTTHRLLAFTPDGDGSNYAHVDLPNIESVEYATTGRGWLVEGGVRALVVGVILLTVGASVDFDGLFGPVSVSGAEQVGVSGLVAAFDLLRAGTAVLDDALLIAGAGGVLLGLAAAAAYLATRRNELVVRVAGDEDIRVPCSETGVDDEAVRQLREAVA